MHRLRSPSSYLMLGFGLAAPAFARRLKQGFGPMF